MDQELLEYLDQKFTRLEDKLDLCAAKKDLDDLTISVVEVEGRVGSHSRIFGALGAIGLAGIGAWFQHWFGKH